MSDPVRYVTIIERFHKWDVNKMGKSINLLAIIGIIGGTMMIVGVFLTWVDLKVVGVSLGTATGWDIFDGLKDVENIKYTFLPLLDLIAGILAVLMMIIPTFANVDGYKKANNALGIIVTILSIAVIVISILFMTQSWDIFGGTIRMSDYIQYGFWISLIGAIITLIGGIMPIAKNRMN